MFSPVYEECHTRPRLTNHGHQSVLTKWLCVYKPPLTFTSQHHDVVRFLRVSVPELSLIQCRPGSCLYYTDSFKCNSRSRTSIPFGLVRPVFVCHSSLTALFSQKLSPWGKQRGPNAARCVRKMRRKACFPTFVLLVFFLLIKNNWFPVGFLLA